MDSSTHFIELIKKISYDTIQEQGYVKKFDGIVVSVNPTNTSAEVRIMGYEATLLFPNKSNTLLAEGDSVKIESPSENFTDAFISEKFGSTKNLAESEIQEMIVEFNVNDSPVVAPPQDDPDWSAISIDRPLNRYIWQRTRIVYADKETFSTPVNITGANGSAPPLCNIYGENIFKYDINGELISSNTITLTADILGTTINKWQFKNASAEWVDYPSSVITNVTLNVLATDNVFIDDVATIRCTTQIESAQDIVSITKVRDGASGYTVLLSNENVTFAGTTVTDPSSAISLVQAFLGITPLITNVQTIADLPVGMTVTIQNNNSISTQITVNVDEDFDTKNGELQIPIIVEGKTFSKTFSYSLVLNGEDGVGISTTINEFYLSTSQTETIGGEWQTTAPVWENGKYMWVRQKIIYTDGKIQYTEAYIDSSWEAAKDKASIYSSQPTSYKKNDLWILEEPWGEYIKGDILSATQDSVVFVAEHWIKKNSYTDMGTVDSSLKPLIEQNASNIKQESDEIRAEVSTNYVKNEQLEAAQTTIISQTSDQIEFVRNTLNGEILDVSNGLTNYQDYVEEYIRFEGAKITMGKEGNSFTTEIDNEKFAILESGQPVTYLSNQKLYVTSGEFINDMTIGNFKWTPRNNGNLSLIFIGTNN